MQRYIVFPLLLLLAAVVVGCQTTPTTASTNTPLNGSSATLVVHGMACPMCANNIDRQLLRVPGVQKVDVDLGTGKIVVAFAPDAHPSREAIVHAVEESGFALREFRQP